MLPDVGIGPGQWHVGVWASGRAEAAALPEDFDVSAQGFPNGPERWLLQFWPGERSRFNRAAGRHTSAVVADE